MNFGDRFSTRRAFEVGAINGLAPDSDALQKMTRDAAKAASVIGTAQIAATKRRLYGPEIERVSQFLVEKL